MLVAEVFQSRKLTSYLSTPPNSRPFSAGVKITVDFVPTQAETDASKDALMSDICIGTSSAPTYLPAYHFKTKDSKGNDREFHLVDGGVAANNPVRQI